MFHFWRNLTFMEECAIFGGKCHFWRNVPFLEECAIFGRMCHFWRNVPILEESAVFGGICHFWINMPFLDKCAIFGWMCHFCINSHIWGLRLHYVRHLAMGRFWRYSLGGNWAAVMFQFQITSNSGSEGHIMFGWGHGIMFERTLFEDFVGKDTLHYVWKDTLHYVWKDTFQNMINKTF